MTVAEIINDEKVEFDVNRAAAKISALSPNKIQNYEKLTDKYYLLIKVYQQNKLDLKDI